MQNKTIETIANELSMLSNQILAKFYDAVKKVTKTINTVLESTVEEILPTIKSSKETVHFGPLKNTIDEELEADVKKIEKSQKRELKKLKDENLSQFAIKGTEVDWKNALQNPKSKVISVKV